jgi:hypothetical protein
VIGVRLKRQTSPPVSASEAMSVVTPPPFFHGVRT